MKFRQAAAVAICVAIVLAAYLAWDRATQSFNPSPTAVSLDTGATCSPGSPPCPAFGVDSANLTVKTSVDITSQALTLTLTAAGPTDVDRLSVFFSGVPIGNYSRTVVPGDTITDSWAVPTTLNVTVGDTYSISVRAQSFGQNGTASAQYWSSVQVTAA